MIKAVGENIIVEKDPVAEINAQGIVIPADLQRTPRFNPTTLATIVSVGPRCQYPALSVGVRIALREAWGSDYFYDNRKLTILSEREYRDCCIAV